jgi:hypothetical protein
VHTQILSLHFACVSEQKFYFFENLIRDHVKRAREKSVTADSRSLFDFQKKSPNREIRLAEMKSVKCNSDVITRKPKTKKMSKK